MLTSLKGHLAVYRRYNMKPLSARDLVAIKEAFPNSLSYHAAQRRVWALQDHLASLKRLFKHSALTILLGILIGGPAVAVVYWTQH